MQPGRRQAALLDGERRHGGVLGVPLRQQLLQPDRGGAEAGEPGDEAGHPRRPGEGDLAAVEVDGAGRISLDLENPGSALRPQIVDDGHDPRPG